MTNKIHNKEQTRYIKFPIFKEWYLDTNRRRYNAIHLYHDATYSTAMTETEQRLDLELTNATS